MYEVDGYFGHHAYSLYGKEWDYSKRSLIAVPVAFPLRASGTAAWIQAAALKLREAVHAGGGRKGLF